MPLLFQAFRERWVTAGIESDLFLLWLLCSFLWGSGGNRKDWLYMHIFSNQQLLHLVLSKFPFLCFHLGQIFQFKWEILDCSFSTKVSFIKKNSLQKYSKHFECLPLNSLIYKKSFLMHFCMLFTLICNFCVHFTLGMLSRTQLFGWRTSSKNLEKWKIQIAQEVCYVGFILPCKYLPLPYSHSV